MHGFVSETFRLLSCLLVTLVICFRALADDWPQWRGPRRDNVSLETGLLTKWPAAGPELVWRTTNLGFGLTSVAVAGPHVYTLCDQHGREYLLALDRKTGAKVWATEIGPAHKIWLAMRWFTQRTPTADEERVYAFTSTGVLHCIDVNNGRILWSKNYPLQYQAEMSLWGHCDYPLVDGEQLICVPGGHDATVVALDKATGAEIWQTLLPDSPKAGYSATVTMELFGKRMYVFGTETRIEAVDAQTGKPLWSYDGNFRLANSYTPHPLGKHLLVGNGYGFGIALLSLSEREEGLYCDEIYRQRQQFFPLWDNVVVVGSDVYAATARGRLICRNWRNGDLRWRAGLNDPPPGNIAMTWAEGHGYLQHSEGAVSLVKVKSDGCREVSRLQLPDARKKRGSTYPVIANGLLYLRDEDQLFCYSIAKQAPAGIAKATRTVSLEWPKAPESSGEPFPIFVPTPADIAHKMLELTDVKRDETVVDLGSGDGVIVARAAKFFDAKAIGYEINPDLVKISRELLQEAGVTERARIEAKDFYTVDLGDVDVATAYLNPEALAKLIPQFRQMKEGARIVTHGFAIPGIEPEKQIDVRSRWSENEHKLWLYRVPLNQGSNE